jgi:hypothetical protein
MVTIEDYKDREQSYVKHVFLESYLERLAHKTANHLKRGRAARLVIDWIRRCFREAPAL